LAGLGQSWIQTHEPEDDTGMTRHRLAILPGMTHYDINVAPALAEAVIPFLSGGRQLGG
jgi:hypothetical protein